MHKTHLLGRAGQLSQAYFTYPAPILTPPRSASDCQQIMAAIARIPYATQGRPRMREAISVSENVEILGETRPHRAGRACVKPFLFPVKSRRSLADFNTESIVCCLAQRVI